MPNRIWFMRISGKRFRYIKAEPPCNKGEISFLGWLCGWEVSAEQGSIGVGPAQVERAQIADEGQKEKEAAEELRQRIARTKWHTD